jgi:hypothetical protein
MAGRPALFRERELDKAINAARKVGTKQVKFECAGICVTIPLPGDGDETAPDDSNNSFDKIMRKP